MDGRHKPESPAYPGAPRWVKLVGAISIALVATFVILHLAGGGFHHSHRPEAAHDSHRSGANTDKEAR